MKIDKLRTLSSLQKEVQDLQLQGKRCVFTNGCFDLVHVGHVRYLSAARASGDFLIVAVNSDKSVRTLKGNKRPIMPQSHRLEVLAAFCFVDYLILFTGATPKRLIAALNPDILVKGDDWPLKDIVGRDLVEQRGGKVVRIKTIRGASTSALINKIVRDFSKGLS
ncbi:D-glycero-beta-D-manno-heptose 1-phosphate adenylyltransferase [Nitrospira defluvii]|nr:D-glycero-beta-D-manno-heptose 1-phosphate adenylyltransferase [Nitrospira defluvii]